MHDMTIIMWIGILWKFSWLKVDLMEFWNTIWSNFLGIDPKLWASALDFISHLLLIRKQHGMRKKIGLLFSSFYHLRFPSALFILILCNWVGSNRRSKQTAQRRCAGSWRKVIPALASTYAEYCFQLSIWNQFPKEHGINLSWLSCDSIQGSSRYGSFRAYGGSSTVLSTFRFWNGCDDED